MRRIALVLILTVLASCAPPGEGGPGTPVTAPPVSSPTFRAPAPSRTVPGAGASLVRIIDGDTIVVRVGGQEERVRFIGIDSPERDECFSREATEHLRRLIGGRRVVRLVRDLRDRDRYGRLLRYVYAGTSFLNARMVDDGYALASTYPPDVAHADEFRALQRRAREGRRGLWAPGACPRSDASPLEGARFGARQAFDDWNFL